MSDNMRCTLINQYSHMLSEAAMTEEGRNYGTPSEDRTH